MPQKAPRSVSDLEIELNSVKAKLNEQKILVQQLEKARNYWIEQARLARGIRHLSGLTVRMTSPFDPFTDDRRVVHRRTLCQALQRLSEPPESVQPGYTYYMRIQERTDAADEITPFDIYIVDITMWKVTDHGTTDSNA